MSTDPNKMNRSTLITTAVAIGMPKAKAASLTSGQLITYIESKGADHEPEGGGIEGKATRQGQDGEGREGEGQGQGEGEGQSDTDSGDGDGDMFPRARKSLADYRPTPDNPKRNTVSSEAIKRLVQEEMGDSNKLANTVLSVIQKHRDVMGKAMGLPDEMKSLGDQMLKDIEAAWTVERRDVDQRLKEIEQRATRKLVYAPLDLPAVEIENPHFMFEDLLFNATMRLATLLVGPSGSGKTTAAMHLARVMNMPFSYISMGPTQTEHTFSGYTDAQGVFIPKEFYLRYRYGGVLLIDELDASEPSTLLWTNAAIQNKLAGFPRGTMSDLERNGFAKDAEELAEAGGMIPMHPDCIIVASANTYGRGADMMYVGRRPLDASTLKRYKVIYWDYDEALEKRLSLVPEWCDLVQAARKIVIDNGIQHVVSPVDSIDGSRMILAGKDPAKVLNETVLAGLAKHDRTALEKQLVQPFRAVVAAISKAKKGGKKNASANASA